MIKHLPDLKCLRIIHNNRITRRAVAPFNSFCCFILFQTFSASSWEAANSIFYMYKKEALQVVFVFWKRSHVIEQLKHKFKKTWLKEKERRETRGGGGGGKHTENKVREWIRKMKNRGTVYFSDAHFNLSHAPNPNSICPP